MIVPFGDIAASSHLGLCFIDGSARNPHLTANFCGGGDSDDVQLQAQTAMVMVNKGGTLGQGGDTAAALEAYDTAGYSHARRYFRI